MAQSIKGITIELGADTTKLGKALADVNRESSSLQKELRQVDSLLQFDSGNLDLVSQKQQILAQNVDATTRKLDSLKAVQGQVNDQFAKGDISGEQYRSFQREIINTENKLTSLKKTLSEVDNGNSLAKVEKGFKDVGKQAQDAEKDVKGFGDSLSTAVGGIVAGGGIAGVIGSALDSSSLQTKIDITFDVPESSQAAVRDAIKGVEAYGVDAEAALEGVRRQWALNGDATDEANARVIEGAGAIARNYAGIDFTELIQETNEIAGGLNISNEEALGLVNSLLKTGFPPEQLDIISEYGEQLSRAGFSAEEVQNLFSAGVDTSTWNIDNLLDKLLSL